MAGWHRLAERQILKAQANGTPDRCAGVRATVADIAPRFPERLSPER